MSAPIHAPARAEGVILLVAPLVAIYAVSQFLRNSVAVIASDLSRDLALSASDVGLLSSAFFLSFAMAQIPVGIAIDRYGPWATMVATSVLAIIGALVFSLAQDAATLILARVLMGLGCSTFFMAPLTIYARRFPPDRFAALASIQMGLANLGTLGATAPLATSVTVFGWRESFFGIGLLTALLVVVVAALVPRDPKRGHPRGSWGDAVRGVGRAIRAPHFGPVFFVHLTAYSTFASVIGLWAGPWLSDVYGLDLSGRGRFLLVGAVAQMIGLFLWGTADRRIPSYKLLVLAGGCASAGLLVLAATMQLEFWAVGPWLAAFGFAVAFTPIVTAHGKALFPPDLIGRGITLMNVGSIGGAFLSQTVTGFLIDFFGRDPSGAISPIGYRFVFAALAAWLLLSLLIYRRVSDPHPRSHALRT
ncbi:MFS transporter [Microvirga massiliensis]|uniref:MFS transporter n=1 Tax=Microvirga massiliensis TaxID=1033741 RepID=UPI00062BEC43|nr:MFS transporter [Microvirga massiliensis]